MRKFTLFLFFAIAFAISCSKSDKNNKPIYPTDCANYLAGAYTGSDICSGSGPLSYPCTITANTSTNITIGTLYGVPVTAELNCAKNTLTIPTQSFSGSFSISGSGTYTQNRIIINWNGLSAGYPFTCSTTYTR